MFDFLKPKKQKEKRLYVVIETRYPEFIDNVKLCYSKEQADGNEKGDISELEYSTQKEDLSKIVYVFKESNENE